jgi:hypothetical protein
MADTTVQSNNGKVAYMGKLNAKAARRCLPTTSLAPTAPIQTKMQDMLAMRCPASRRTVRLSSPAVRAQARKKVKAK